MPKDVSTLMSRTGKGGPISPDLKDREFTAIQASLLALNAAFEAAREGEAGEEWAAAVLEMKRLALKAVDGMENREEH